MKSSSQNTGACFVALCKEKVVVVVVDDYTYYPGGGGGTTIHYLYGYVPSNGVVI